MKEKIARLAKRLLKAVDVNVHPEYAVAVIQVMDTHPFPLRGTTWAWRVRISTSSADEVHFLSGQVLILVPELVASLYIGKHDVPIASLDLE